MSSNAPTPRRLRLRATGDVFPKTIITGRQFAPYEDLYHFILTQSWSTFFGLIIAVFATVNAIFAALYRVVPGCISSVSSYEQAFFFSVQTLGTIGYGGMAPETRYGHVVVSIEALVGLLMTAMITGLTFSKFARPTARVLFSARAVICPRNGVPHLMFRMANWRHNQVAEVRLRVSLLVDEQTAEGERMRRFIEVPLVRDNTGVFILTWTAIHLIDEKSPFHGPDPLAKLRERKAELYLSLSGLDESSGSTIHARHRYLMDDIAVGARFDDVITVLDDGTRHLNYERFHDVIQLPPPP